MTVTNENPSVDANLNETGRRDGEDRRQDSTPVVKERREVQRRRQIDPTTCERDYTDPEIEFMQALDQYKRDSGRMFPTCSEILEVLLGLGYRRLTESDLEATDCLMEDEPMALDSETEAESDLSEEESVVFDEE